MARQAARAGEQVAYVSLGSNLGDRAHHLAAGIAALRARGEIRDVELSRVYETEAVGPGDQRPYLNAVARLCTSLSPRALLACLLAIEHGEGRERGALRNLPRTLDLDLLLYGACEIREPELVVPHPRLVERPFVLEPLCDLAPDLVVPGASERVSALAAAVRDPRAVRVSRESLPEV
jgi:2-amino-4-hydroxy-6-hydroxymethyldihydropteridine diphosphokinase